MIRCTDGSLYTGVTTDVERRFREHKEGKLGARYTRARQPVAVVCIEQYSSRSDAQVREAQLKKYTKLQKEQTVKEYRKTIREEKSKKKNKNQTID